LNVVVLGFVLDICNLRQSYYQFSFHDLRYQILLVAKLTTLTQLMITIEFFDT